MNSTHQTDTDNGLTKNKRGSKSASIEDNYNGDKSEIGKFIRDSFRWFNCKKVESDDELAERLNEFFETCEKEHSFPTVEKMSLALGVDRKTLWRWENGEEGSTPARRHMIKKAKELLASIDADLVQKGKIPQITYIFRAKNYFDMHDKQEHVHSTPSPLDGLKSEEELRRIYQSAIPEECD